MIQTPLSLLTSCSIIIWRLIAIFGFVLAAATLNTGARYFAMCVFATGVYAISGISLSWIATTCGQTKEKKAISLALANTIAGVAPIYTPVSHYSLQRDPWFVLTSYSISGRHLTHLDILSPWASARAVVLLSLC